MTIIKKISLFHLVLTGLLLRYADASAQSMKGVNAADGTLKDIAEYLGRCFGVDMKNIHGKSHVISNRLNP